MLLTSYSNAISSSVRTFVPSAVYGFGQFAWGFSRVLYFSHAFKHIFEDPQLPKHAFQAAVFKGLATTAIGGTVVLQLILVGKGISNICNTHRKIKENALRLVALCKGTFHQQYPYEAEASTDWSKDYPILPASWAKTIHRLAYRIDTTIHIGMHILKDLGLQLVKLMHQYADTLQTLEGDSLTEYKGIMDLVSSNDPYLEKLRNHEGGIFFKFKKLEPYIEQFLLQMKVDRTFVREKLDNISSKLDTVNKQTNNLQSSLRGSEIGMTKIFSNLGTTKEWIGSKKWGFQKRSQLPASNLEKMGSLPIDGKNPVSYPGQDLPNWRGQPVIEKSKCSTQ